MAGTFTHIALVYSLCREAHALESIEHLTIPMKRALQRCLKYCELGAVSPDYPYLTLLDSNASGWANVMHYWNTADFIRKAVPLIWDMNYATINAWRCLAWIFGYAAHVVTDLTVHPVVNLKVGPYAEHQTDHRVCEMNQDVYIMHKNNLGDVTTAEYIRDCGIASCSDPDNPKKFDPVIAGIWNNILDDIPIDTVQFDEGVVKPQARHDFDRWHRNFVLVVDKVAEEGGSLPPFSRHFAEKKGLVYPDYENLDRGFIDNLTSPEGGPIHFDEVFGRTQENVRQAWSELALALDRNEPELFTLANGNLDTGMSGSHSIFWRV
jgi:hypothetical protein